MSEWNTNLDAAPRDGSWIEIDMEPAGYGHRMLVHWAHGGGEDQPRFGPGWFYWNGYYYSEVGQDRKIVRWRLAGKD